MKFVQILLLSSIFLLFGACDYPVKPPPRPEAVPPGAKWIGGADGGYWVQFVSHEQGFYRFKLFSKSDGELAMDALFAPSENCSGVQFPTDSKILTMVTYAMEETIGVASEGDSHRTCSLELKPPAFGGSGWEIKKEKATTPSR